MAARVSTARTALPKPADTPAALAELIAAAARKDLWVEDDGTTGESDLSHPMELVRIWPMFDRTDAVAKAARDGLLERVQHECGDWYWWPTERGTALVAETNVDTKEISS